METNRRRLTVLVICAVTAIPFALTTARAEAAPNWMLGPQLGKLPAELSAKAETALSLTTKIAAIKVTFSCEKVSLDKGLLEAEGKSSGTGLFSGCKTSLNEKASAVCEPLGKKGIEAEKGNIPSQALKGQLVLHEGAPLMRLEPVVGTTLAKAFFGEECSLPEEVPIIGSFYAKDSGGKFEAEEEAHLLETGPLTELWAISKTAEHVATTAGKVQLSMIGTNLGRPWSGLGS